MAAHHPANRTDRIGPTSSNVEPIKNQSFASLKEACLLDNLKFYLQSRTISDRKNAAKRIATSGLVDLGAALLDAYLYEKRSSQTWQAQLEMILSLGIIRYVPALKQIIQIIEANEPYDRITIGAARSYVRICRESLADVAPVLRLLKRGRYSVLVGALDAVGYDKMMPNVADICHLLDFAKDLHRHPDRAGKEGDLSDPRYGLAAACPGWDPKLTRDFLEHCVETAGGDRPLVYVATRALAGKYVKLR